MSSGSPSSLPRLGPTWSKGGGGRGFQPPPPAVTRARSGSAGSSGSEGRPPNVNKFSVLDDDEDVNGTEQQPRPANSRSEALRTFQRSSSSGAKPTGRSLADLAAGAPPSTGHPRSSSTGYREEGGGRFSGLSSGDGDGKQKVIRYTRERLLSMRKAPGPDDPNPPEVLKHLEGTSVLSPEPLDPVCWDTFDPDEIWAQVPRERMSRSGSIGGPKGPPTSRLDAAAAAEDKRRASAGGRWQRGVALPPPEETANRTSRRPPQVDAENPNDLWDDPVTGGAASDFSAFGAIPDEPGKGGGGGGGDVFDFEKMTEATNRFEMERHGSKGSDAFSEGEDEQNVHAVHVNPHRPLASAGTTIQSGSGDDVNVFEDFDETPGESDAAVKGAGEDTSASSRLMKMIGVNKESTDDKAAAPDEAPAPAEVPAADTPATKEADSWGLAENSTEVQAPKGAAIPSNPWGSIIGADPNPQQQSGMDLASRLEAVSAEQKARDAQIAAEMERRKAQEEEAKRRAQQQSAAARPQQPSQVELVLMERISTFLENSWGKSDLMSILSTLHAEDSRVIPLLGNVDALRALISRHPNRIGLRQDPAFGSEMAVLLLTNAQWAKQEQIARQEEQQRIELQRREEAMRRAAAQKPQVPVISADAPWFYSDPQNNVQGPFRGEEMRQWLEAGYFKGDLPISQQPTGPFVPLQALFSDISQAFRVPGDASRDNAAAEAAAAAAEEERRAREEEERRVAEERRAAEERARAEASAVAERREQAVAAEKNRAAAKDQNQSAQLKMMLGLGNSGSSNQNQNGPAQVQEQPREAPQQEKAPKSKKLQQRQPSPAAEVPAKAPAASPAWGGGASAAPRKSIAEIQQEEARTAARMAMERKHNPRSSSGGWANIAASKGGSTGWQSGTVKATPAAVVTNPSATAATARSTRPSQATTGQRQANQRSRGAASSDNPADDFGASMSPALEKWCRDQMKKLNGSDDLTLVSFCMTLNDSDEIRQYLTAYLGSTPQVNNFATEFINRKNGGKGKQEEWESATKGKKGKKSKK